MGRIKSREVLFTLIFETLFSNPENNDTYEKYMLDEDLSAESKCFVKDNFINFIEHKDEIEATLKSNLNNINIERVFKVDLALLFLAIEEIIYYKKTPAKVVVNECVELSKKYSTDKSYSFINGVLANILKNLKED